MTDALIEIKSIKDLANKLLFTDGVWSVQSTNNF